MKKSSKFNLFRVGLEIGGKEKYLTPKNADSIFNPEKNTHLSDMAKICATHFDEIMDNNQEGTLGGYKIEDANIIVNKAACKTAYRLSFSGERDTALVYPNNSSLTEYVVHSIGDLYDELKDKFVLSAAITTSLSFTNASTDYRAGFDVISGSSDRGYPTLTPSTAGNPVNPEDSFRCINGLFEPLRPKMMAVVMEVEKETGNITDWAIKVCFTANSSPFTFGKDGEMLEGKYLPSKTFIDLIINGLFNNTVAKKNEDGVIVFDVDTFAFKGELTAGELSGRVRSWVPKFCSSTGCGDFWQIFNSKIKNSVLEATGMQAVIIDGSDIDSIYNDYHSFRNEDNESPELQQSCMNSKDISMEMYSGHKMAVLCLDENEESLQDSYNEFGVSALHGKMVGRAILWTDIEGKSESTNSYDKVDYCLDRMYCKTNHRKLFSRFIKEKLGVDELITAYNDGEKSECEFYRKAGFKMLRAIVPNSYEAPYFDSFNTGDRYGNDSIALYAGRCGEYCFDETDGTNPVNRGLWSDYHEEYIEPGEEVWSDHHHSWMWRDEVTEVDGDFYISDSVFETEDTGELLFYSHFEGVVAYDSTEEPIEYNGYWYAEYAMCDYDGEQYPLEEMEEVDEKGAQGRVYIGNVEDFIEEYKTEEDED